MSGSIFQRYLDYIKGDVSSVHGLVHDMMSFIRENHPSGGEWYVLQETTQIDEQTVQTNIIGLTPCDKKADRFKNSRLDEPDVERIVYKVPTYLA